MEDPVILLKRNLYGHPLARQFWEKQFEKILLKHGWEKIPKKSIWENQHLSWIMKTWAALKDNVK